MQPETLSVWTSLIRDILLPLAAIMVTLVLRKKFGVEVDIKKTERLSNIAFDAVMYAEQLARSESHPTANTPEAKSLKAREFAYTRVSEKEQKEIMELVEAWLGKLRTGTVVTSSTPGSVVMTPSLAPPPPSPPPAPMGTATPPFSTQNV